MWQQDFKMLSSSVKLRRIPFMKMSPVLKAMLSEQQLSQVSQAFFTGYKHRPRGWGE
jgi:hypothetical protein